MDLPASLQRSLRFTNGIDSACSLSAQNIRNVKKWKNGSMVQRWLCAALLDAEQRMHCIPGCRSMGVLMAEITRLTTIEKSDGTANEGKTVQYYFTAFPKHLGQAHSRGYLNERRGRNMRIGVITGGGDSSGINAFLYFLYRRLEQDEHELVGFKHGWRGLVQNQVLLFERDRIEKNKWTPGTILGTSRTNPVQDGTVDELLHSFDENNIEALVAVGGDDTLSVAGYLSNKGVRIIGVPQTIDNDVPGTDLCLGFETSLFQAANIINSLMPSNVAHERDMVAEVMGRDSGWISLYTSLNTGACACMCPEGRMDMGEVVDALMRYRRQTKRSGLVIVAEGIALANAKRIKRGADPFGNEALEGVGFGVAQGILEKTGHEPRVQVLGYALRGGHVVPSDVRLAFDFANEAVDNILKGRTGLMVGRKATQVCSVSLTEVVGRRRMVPKPELNAVIQRLVH